MNGGIFYVTLKLEDLGAQMASLESTQERGEWLEGFHVGVHGHQARDQWSGVKMQGYEFGALTLEDAGEKKGKFSKAGKASADARKAVKGSAQPERRLNDVETTFENRSEHSSNHPLTINQEPLPKIQKPRTKKSFLSEAASIYEAYPRKIGKTSALKAIEKALASTSVETLMEAVNAYAAAVSSWPERDKAFIPHPATWFNAGRWEDDRASWVKTNGKPTTLTRVFDSSYYEEK